MSAGFELGLSSMRYVFDSPLVIQQVALRVANRTAIFGNPNNRPVLAIYLRFEPLNRIVLLHPPDELVTPILPHV